MTGFVYKWTDSSNGKYYIGSHLGDPSDKYKGGGTVFRRAYKKRKECFSREVLYIGADFRELEEFILEELDAANDDMSYNLKNKAIGAGFGTDNHMYGKSLTDDAKEKLREHNLGKKHSLATLKKMRSTRKGGDNSHSKKVFCGYLNTEFDTISDCAKALDVSQPYLTRMIKGERANKFNVTRI